MLPAQRHHVTDDQHRRGLDLPVDDRLAEGAQIAVQDALVFGGALLDDRRRGVGGAARGDERLRKHLHGTDIEVYPVSAATRKGFDELMGAIVRILPTLPDMRTFAEEVEMEAAPEAPFTVFKDGEVYVVEGPAMDMLIGSVNFSDVQSLNYFHRTLRSRGVIDALRAAGAKEGDVVAIGDMEFDFID